jgi:hypothetical protein
VTMATFVDFSNSGDHDAALGLTPLPRAAVKRHHRVVVRGAAAQRRKSVLLLRSLCLVNFADATRSGIASGRTCDCD